jgi:hypothetical protein
LRERLVSDVGSEEDGLKYVILECADAILRPNIGRRMAGPEDLLKHVSSCAVFGLEDFAQRYQTSR